MPKIINAFSEENSGLGSAFKAIADSFGNGARNEVYRQEALKGQRENTARDEGSLALQRGDVIEALRQGYRGGMSSPDATGYIRGYYGNTKGADSPEFEGAAVGAGEPWRNTPRGSREMLDQSRFVPYYNEDPRTGAKTPGGAFDTRHNQFTDATGMPATPAPQRSGFQNTGLVDEHGNPTEIAPAPMHLINSLDENGAPLLSEEGRNRLAEHYRRDPGYAGRLLAVIAGRAATPSMNRGSKANNVFLNDLYAIDPSHDPGVNAMRLKTYQDLATSGKTGMMAQALSQFTHHMTEEAIPRMSEVDNVPTLHPFSDSNVLGRAGNAVAAPFTSTVNSARNAYNTAAQVPGVGAAHITQEGIVNELGRLMRGTGTIAEADIARELANFPTNIGAPDFKSRVAAVMGLIEGAYHAREQNINRVLGPDPRREPLISPQTKAELEMVKRWYNGGPMPPMARTTQPQQRPTDAGRMPQGAPQPMVTPQSQAGPGPTDQFNDRFNAAQPGAQPPPTQEPQQPKTATPYEGERRQFKQGWGVFHNGQWMPVR